MNGENPHHTGRLHRRPEDGSPGYIRVLNRGCGGERDYFGEFDCSHGYTWTCEECPVLREQWRLEEIEASKPKPKPRDTKPLELFQHFDSEEAREQFLRDVAQAQKDGTVPF